MNPFEDDRGIYHVLLNEEGQYSLWPKEIAAPVGWNVVLEARSRSICLSYISKHWTDLRPRSVRRAEL
ncbi:MbtH family NRPS accessory protein [Amycolatopsis alba]